MAWPSGTTVREQVLDNILSTCLSISAPGSKTTVNFAGFVGNDVFMVPGYPAVLLASPSVSYDDSIHGIISCKMRVAVVLVLDTSTNTLDSISDFVEDFRMALLADHTRGGVAVDTHISQDDTAPTSVPEPYIVADVVLDVTYRHLRADPTAEI